MCRLVWILCLVAGFRVFLFSAAFPFFNNVDERAHIDLVTKYARGEIPHGLTNFSADSASYFALYSSPEYFLKQEQLEQKEYPPPSWSLPSYQRTLLLRQANLIWQSRPNHESGEPPLYYAIAGAWTNLGRACALNGVRLLYWIRFLDIGIAGGLVWIGYLAARSVFHGQRFPQFAAAVLVSVWPQSALYSVQPDALSPLVFGTAFLGLVRLLEAERPSALTGGWVGLALAATFLTKTSNLPLLFAAVIMVILKSWQLARNRMLRSAWSVLGSFFLCAAVPLGIWCAWNFHAFGDVTATRSKIDLLGWTRKPFHDWWSHPIFGLHGLGEFWPQLMASFWRGEFIWHGERMADSLSDGFYWVSSTVLLLSSLFFLLRRRSSGPDADRGSLWVALFSFLSLVAFLVWLSIAFDFGNCVYPSRAHPYFISGRLLNAAAVPFFLFYAYAIDRLTILTKREWIRWGVMGAIALFVLVSQFWVNAPAFSSKYNFFHVAGAQL